MARAAWNWLRQRLLLWAGLILVALSLLAMHQMSVPDLAGSENRPEAAPIGSQRADSMFHRSPASSMPAASGLLAPVTGGHDHAAAGPAQPSGNACHGCVNHGGMAVSCLVALALLVVGWLHARPGRLLRLRIRQRPPRVPVATVLRRWQRPSWSLVELSVNRN